MHSGAARDLVYESQQPDSSGSDSKYLQPSDRRTPLSSLTVAAIRWFRFLPTWRAREQCSSCKFGGVLQPTFHKSSRTEVRNVTKASSCGTSTAAPFQSHSPARVVHESLIMNGDCARWPPCRDLIRSASSSARAPCRRTSMHFGSQHSEVRLRARSCSICLSKGSGQGLQPMHAASA